jgi:hypothetical protein
MAIKGLNESETISIYDPAVKAYREISLEDFKTQLASFGLTPEEIEAKVKAAKGEMK